MRRAARAVGALAQRLGPDVARSGEPATGVPRLFSSLARGSAAAVSHGPALRVRDDCSPLRQSVPFALRHVRFDSTGGSAAIRQPVALDQPTGEAVDSLASAAGDDVAALAADSNLLVGALQRSIDWVHVTCDLPWWLSIAAVTVALRVAIVPAVVVQMRNTAKLTLARPDMERLQQRMRTQMNDPAAVESYQRDIAAVWAKYDCHPVKSFTPLLAQGPLFVCFFLAIKRMAAALPGFTSGGTAWFVDLSAVDPTYVSPVVSALTFLATVELGGADGMQGNPAARNVKLGMRALAVAMVPLTAGLPQGVFVYWVTSNCFSFAQTAAFKWQTLRTWCRIPDTRHLAGANTPGQGHNAQSPQVLLSSRPASRAQSPGSSRPGGGE